MQTRDITVGRAAERARQRQCSAGGKLAN